MNLGWEPWSSGYRKKLTFQRSWVRIPAPYTGWTFFTFICCKNCNDVCLKRPKINEKRGRSWPIFFYKKKPGADDEGLEAEIDKSTELPPARVESQTTSFLYEMFLTI